MQKTLLLIFAAVTLLTGQTARASTDKYVETFKPWGESVSLCGANPGLPQEKGPAVTNPKKASGPLRADASGVKLYGNVIYMDSWGSSTEQAGVYSLDLDNPTEFVAVSPVGSIFCDGGATMAPSWYVGSMTKRNVNAAATLLTSRWDPSTFALTGSDESTAFNSFALDLTWSPTESRLYGTFYNDARDGYVWGWLDPITNTRTALCPMYKALNGIAADYDGTIYAIQGTTGDVYRIDPATGTLALIGNCGITTAYVVSAAIEPTSGDLYWTVQYKNSSNQIEGLLYRIDKATGEGEKVYALPGNAEVTGIYFPAATYAAGAPARVDNLAIAFDGTALDGRVTFTLPTKTYSGTDGTGELTYTVYVGGEKAAEAAGTWGQAVSVPVTRTAAGAVGVKVVATNAAGTSPYAFKACYVGQDRPSRVSGVTVERKDGKNTVSWTAVTTTEHGGYFDPTRLTYDVYRSRDGGDYELLQSGVTATEYTDEVADVDSVSLYKYGVFSVLDGVSASIGTASNGVLVGYYRVPYLQTFDDESTLDYFTIVDANSDGISWVWKIYTNNAGCGDNQTLDMDDWLISPPLYLEGGRYYTFSFGASSNGPSYTESFEAWFGNAPSVEGMTDRLVSKTNVSTKNTSDFQPFSGGVAVKESGVYYFAIHGVSQPNQFNLNIDNFSVDGGISDTTPAAPTNVSVAPASDGSWKATLSCTAPRTSIGGVTLETLTKLEMLRNGEVIDSVLNPTPGTVYRYTDEGMPGADAYKYSFRAYNEAGCGLESSKTIFVGINVPKEPAFAKIAETENLGEVKVSWGPPMSDKDGYAINPNNCLYRVYNGNAELVLDSLKVYNATFRAVPEGEQAFVLYGVKAFTSAGESSDYAITPRLCVGTSFNTPYAESFSGGVATKSFVTESYNGTVRWATTLEGITFDGIDSQDGDRGFLFASSSGPGASGAMVTGRILIPADCHISYWWYPSSATSQNTVQLKAIERDGTETNLGEAVTVKASDNAWHREVVDLSAVSGKEVQIAIVGTTMTEQFIYLDNLYVGAIPAMDLFAMPLDVPTRVKADQAYDVTCRVANIGLNRTARGFTAKLYVNDELAETQEVEDNVSPDTEVAVTFKRTASPDDAVKSVLRVDIESDDDANFDNNSATLTTYLMLNDLPAPESLTAHDVEGTANVELKWSAPALSETTDSVTQDFASADIPDFTVSDFQTWQVRNYNTAATMLMTGSDGSFVKYENYGKSFGWIIFNVKEADVAWTDHSGDGRMAVAMSHQKGQNDGWLISPQLSGAAQTVSFWAMTPISKYGPEQMEVLYSTTDDATESFQTVTINGYRGFVSINSWARYTVDLPEGAKYFAIRSRSGSATSTRYAFFVDDITYTPAATANLGLAGYNVMRNGAKVNAEPVAVTSYLDTDVAEGSYTYIVSAVYPAGVSRPSNQATTVKTGIIGVGTLDHSVWGEIGKIVMISERAGEAVVTDMAGRVWYAGAFTGEKRVSVPRGVYAVKTDFGTYKVQVK